MKKAKKLTAFLLLAAFVFAFIVPVTAMADTTTGPGSITIDNPQENQNYTAYKIFDVVYDSEGKAYSYTIESTSEWFDVVTKTDESTGKQVSKIDDLTITKAAGSDTTYVVTVDDDFSAASFAEILKESVVGKTGIPFITSEDATTATVTGLKLGYYFVSSTSGALCNLTTTNPSVIIHDKNDVPFEKTVDQHSADIGGTVEFTIEGKVPDTTGFTKYDYIINDTMSDGLTFTNDLKVFVDETELDNEYYQIVPTKKNGDENAPIIGFELTIDVMSLTEKVGKEIKVTYSATVNEHAIENVEKNSATLTYSNDPIKNITTDTKTDEEKVYSSKIEIIKHVTGNEDTMLNGAKFILYKEDENGNKLYYKYDTTNQVVTWINEKSKADVKITGEGNQEDGKAYFEGLKDGTYYLLETEAPDGYNLLPDAQTVQIINDGNNVTTITAPVKLVKVANSTGSVLPSTGGIGTTIFYAVGGVLVVGAGVLLITRKRMSVEK